MGISLINRRILLDLLRFTALSLVGLSALLMMVGAMVEGSRRGLDPVRIMKAMPFLIPPTLPFTMPTCVLFACVIVYGGMSSSNEITALKSAGIHIVRLLQPGFVLATISCIGSIFVADKLVPYCNRKFAEWIMSDMEGMLYTYLSANGSFVENGFPYEIYVQSVRDGKLINPTIVHRTSEGVHDLFAQATEASIQLSTNENGDEIVSLRMIDGVATTNKESAVHFVDKSFPMPIPKTFKSQSEKSEAMTFAECRAKAAERNRSLEMVRWDLAMTASYGALSGNVEPYVQRLSGTKQEMRRIRHKAVQAQAEVPFRVALSSSSIPFVLLGCPISIVFRRRDFLQAFFVCFLPICLIYYPFLMLGFNLFQETGGKQMLWMWGPSLALIAASIPALRHSIRY